MASLSALSRGHTLPLPFPLFTHAACTDSKFGAYVSAGALILNACGLYLQLAFITPDVGQEEEIEPNSDEQHVWGAECSY
jgi:hypothetical protein